MSYLSISCSFILKFYSRLSTETDTEAKRQAIFSVGVTGYTDDEIGDANAESVPVLTEECQVIAKFRFHPKPKKEGLTVTDQEKQHEQRTKRFFAELDNGAGLNAK